MARAKPTRERIVELERQRDELRVAEKMISDAYVRLRVMIPGALDTPHAPTPEQVYETTETALRRALAK